ncbi:WD40 repeat domain-containing protein [Reichenbachiella sp. 5M10]|uniref:WD40 repeat domain-containing protein n=1 Tax=Reichenbachiella sp. 5M10 TaxID=1889772 RepID=UPI0013045C3A|nr:hypothetical protein [Reichenbachiella sp. 5M10]
MESELPNQANDISTNPFPGLRPFKPSESDLFFGRELQISLVFEQLMKQRFIAIVGASGVGKSSFMSCGVVSEITQNQDRSWKVLSMTPGRNPIKSLADSMMLQEAHWTAVPETEDIGSTLLHSPESFKAILKTQAETSKADYLLFIDQFEEIFRFSPDDESGAKAAKSIIDIIVSTLHDASIPVYIVVAIRADFIGDCAKFPRLTEIINKSQYLIPELTREEKKDAIVGPVRYKNAKIEDELVEHILDEMGESADQLPIMQHAMMRTWSQWKKFKSPSDAITFDDYNAIGGIKNALSEHAREAYKELNREDQILCQKIFKTLTEKGDGGRGIRRPTRLKDICDIVDAEQTKITNIIDFFRSPSRSLLLPPAGTDIKDDTVIDISHESLMRNWIELSDWVEEEAESVKLYLRLAEASLMHQEGKAGLWLPPDLLLAQDWYKKQKPSLAWGLMHNKAFESTMLFLEQSESEYERSQILKEKVQKRRIVIFRRIAAVMFLLTLAAGWSWIKARESAKDAEEKKILAEKATEKANEQEELARISANEAVLAKEDAIHSAKIARNQERIARQAKVEADTNALRALRQEQQANDLRLLSIAKSMAIKSKEIDANKPEKKALVAKQAYNFYESVESSGKTKKLEKDPDIYDGLYYALISLGDDNAFTLSEHEQNVRSIITSKKGNIYSTGSDGSIIQWKNNQFHSFVKENKSGTRINKSLAINSDESRLACSGNFNFIEIYDIKSGKGLVETIPTTWTDTWHIAFTHDGNLICIGTNDQLMLYTFDTKTFTPITEVIGKINAVSAHPAKNEVVVGLDNGAVEQYNLATKSVTTIMRSNSSIYAVNYSHDGSRLAVGDEKGKVYLITAHQMMELPGHSARVNQIAFDHSSHFLATASFDKTVRIWNVRSSDDAPIILRDHQDWVWSIAFTQDDNHLWAGSRDYLIRTWPLDMDDMASLICPNPKITRTQLNEEEWIHYAGEDFSSVVNATCN